MLLHIFIFNSEKKTTTKKRNTQQPISSKNALACVYVPKSVLLSWCTFFLGGKLALLKFLAEKYLFKKSTVHKLQSNYQTKSL